MMLIRKVTLSLGKKCQVPSALPDGSLIRKLRQLFSTTRITRFSMDASSPSFNDLRRLPFLLTLLPTCPPKRGRHCLSGNLCAPILLPPTLGDNSLLTVFQFTDLTITFSSFQFSHLFCQVTSVRVYHSFLLSFALLNTLLLLLVPSQPHVVLITALGCCLLVL